MVITSIEPITKDRFRIKLDSGEKFVLYKGEIRLLKLKTEMELDENTYCQITKGILLKRSKLRAMNLLKARNYTEYQLRKKLCEGEYPEDIIDQAISYIKSFHYIDDKAYAIEFIKEQYERHSKKEIYQKLLQKGINRELLEEAFIETYGNEKNNESNKEFDETYIIKKSLVKRGFTGNESYEDKQKMLAYFYRRGFDMDIVYRAMDSINE